MGSCDSTSEVVTGTAGAGGWLSGLLFPDGHTGLMSDLWFTGASATCTREISTPPRFAAMKQAPARFDAG